MDPLLGAALITGGASIIGNIFGSRDTSRTNDANLRIAKMNNQFNEAMMEKQMAYNTEMWHMQNDYNDPTSQIQRYKNAGINPAAVLGSFNAGNAQSVNGVSPAQASPAAPQQAFRPDMSGIELAGRMIFEKRKQDAEIKHLEMDTIRQEIENRTSYQEAIARIDEMKQRTKSSKMRDWLDNQRLHLQREQMSMDWEKHRSQMRNEALQAEGIRLDNYAKRLNNEQLPSILKVSLAQAAADLEYTRSQKKLTDEQYRHEVQKIIETQERSTGYKLDNATKKATEEAIIEAANLNNEARRLENQYNSRTFDARVEKSIYDSLGPDFQRRWHKSLGFWRDSHERKYGKYVGE